MDINLPPIQLYNTLSRKKEPFEPLNPPFVGMYVCGPTVYGEAHLGHARPAITFDLIFRYLKHFGLKVRYVRNVTDVGHLEDEGLGEGEDKIAKKARLEKLEPMEVVQYYTNSYHKNMAQLNVLEPSIEPHATGHIMEQIEMIKKILDQGYAYESNGNIYFDLEKYNKDYHYGILSGRNIEDMLSTTRDLKGQQEKKNSFDFALWKAKTPEHIMHWPSPWGDGFPGWHMECSAMGRKYLGDYFDIHGGGMDLLFPHHESEIAQSTAAYQHAPVKYWIHNNMITINGQKMGKSLNNFITLNQFFSGEHQALTGKYSPMTIRFFILQAHYRSTLDFSNEALQASEKGLKKLLAAEELIYKMPVSDQSSFNIADIKENFYKAMSDDFNSPIAIAALFDGIKSIHAVYEKKMSITKKEVKELAAFYQLALEDILGLQKEDSSSKNNDLLNYLMNQLLEARQQAKINKDWTKADQIRKDLEQLNVVLKDTKDGTEWTIE